VKVYGKEYPSFIIELLNKAQILITQKMMKAYFKKMNQPQVGTIQNLIVYLLQAIIRLAQTRKIL